MENPKRWEIAVCERGTIHVHYGTGSLHILAEDFRQLAREIHHLALHLETCASPREDRNKKRMLQ